MTEMQAPQYYSADEIFETIPDDPENVMMKIPPELCEKWVGLKATILKSP